jgi:hypothetical protein
MKDDVPIPPAAGDEPAPDLLGVALDAAREDLPTRAELAGVVRGLPFKGRPLKSPEPPAPVPSLLPGVVIGALLGLLVVGGELGWEATRSAPPEPTATIPPRVVPTSARAPIEPAPRAEIAARPRAPRAERPAAPPSADVVASAAAPPSAEPADDAGAVDDETETQLLQRTLDALGRSPAEALTLTALHQRRFPGGSLAQEREVLAVDALIRLGRRDEARARAARFVESYPRSAHRRRLEALLAE